MHPNGLNNFQPLIFIAKSMFNRKLPLLTKVNSRKSYELPIAAVRNDSSRNKQTRVVLEILEV